MSGYTQSKIKSLTILKCKVKLDKERMVQSTENTFFSLHLKIKIYHCIIIISSATRGSQKRSFIYLICIDKISHPILIWMTFCQEDRGSDRCYELRVQPTKRLGWVQGRIWSKSFWGLQKLTCLHQNTIFFRLLVKIWAALYDQGW